MTDTDTVPEKTPLAMPRRTAPKASLPPPPPSALAAAKRQVPSLEVQVDIDMDEPEAPEETETPVPNSTPQFARFFGGRDSQQPGADSGSRSASGFPLPPPESRFSAADDSLASGGNSEDSGLASLLRDNGAPLMPTGPVAGGPVTGDPVTMDLTDMLPGGSEGGPVHSSAPPPRRHRDSSSNAPLTSAPPPPPGAPPPPPPSAAPPPPPSAAPPPPPSAAPPPPPSAAPPPRLTGAPPPPPQADARPIGVPAALPPQASAPPPPRASAPPRQAQTQMGLAPSASSTPPRRHSETTMGLAPPAGDAQASAPPPPPRRSSAPVASAPPPPATAALPISAPPPPPTASIPPPAPITGEAEQHAAAPPPHGHGSQGPLPPVPSVVAPTAGVSAPLPLPSEARASAPPAASLPPPPEPPEGASPALYGGAEEGYDEAVTQVIQPDQIEAATMRHRTTSPPSAAAQPARATDPNKRNLWVGIAAAALVVLGLFFTMSSSTGKLLVAVSGPNGAAVEDIKVLLDDKLVCESSPCLVDDVEASKHLLTVEAKGFPKMAATAIVIKAGEDTVHNVRLGVPEATDKAGLEVLANGPGLTLKLDGKDVGSLPQKIADLTPGPHNIVVSGEQYEAQEQTIELLAGQVLTLQPFKLKVLKGLATIRAGKNADGATVTLDGRRIRLPKAAELDASKPHKLLASKDGHEPFQMDIVFEAGTAEQSISVTLNPVADEETDKSDTAAASQPAGKAKAGRPRRKTRGKAAKGKKATKSKKAAKKAPAGGTGILNLNSVPAALVILDGKPIGRTPKMGIRVSAGPHSVVFVSDKGRKRASTTVKAGASKTLMAKF